MIPHDLLILVLGAFLGFCGVFGSLGCALVMLFMVRGSPMAALASQKYLPFVIKEEKEEQIIEQAYKELETEKTAAKDQFRHDMDMKVPPFDKVAYRDDVDGLGKF